MTLEYRCSNCGSVLQTTNADPLNDEIERLRALIMLGDFTNLRPNSDSFKLVQQIRREQSTGEQASPVKED